MTLRARLLLAFLALALVPTVVLTTFTLDRLGRALEMWNTPGVSQALESALETAKTSLARMEATVLAQAEDWALALPSASLTTARRSAIRAGLRASGLDFLQLYRREGGAWHLLEEVRPEGVLAVARTDLSSEIDRALAGDRVIRSAQGALAAAARGNADLSVVAGMSLHPGYFEEVARVGEGAAFYRRSAVVRDVSRTYLLLLVIALVLALTAAALWAATGLAAGMTRPLRNLEEAVERVSAGDLETRVRPHGAREVVALGERFNAMTARLAEARASLQRAEREAAWREVARRLAHEFTNILTPMSLSLHRLRRRATMVPAEHRGPVEESLDALRDGVDQMARLSEQFSQYARLPEPRLERVDLGDLARAAASLHEHEGIEVTFAGARDCPLWVRGDGILLSRAIHNLVLNACEASPPGSGVEVRAGPEGERAVVEVADRGVGLPLERRERLFEPYVSTKARGSGLGLSLVRDIAGQHGGAVTLEDREGGGARARLALPLWRDGLDEEENP